MVMSLIESLTRIKNAVYGREVREAIHDGVFRANQIADGADAKADNTQIRQDAVEAYNDQMIQEMTDKDVISAPEIIMMRDGEPTANARLERDYNQISSQLDDTTAQLAETVKKNVLSVNVRDFGAMGNEINDDTSSFQEAIDYLGSAGGGRLVIPPGIYRMESAIDLVSNLHMEVQKGAVLKKYRNNNTLNFPSHAKGYDGGLKNILIDGGGMFHGNFEKCDGVIGFLHHTKNLTVRNIVFYECVYESHVFDLAGCSDILIEECFFYGQKLSPTRAYAEAIQVDYSAFSSLSSSKESERDNVDGSPSKDVTVRNCRFLPIYNEDNSIKYYAPHPTGGHRQWGTNPSTNIKFVDNYVVDVLPDSLYSSGIQNDRCMGVLHFTLTDGLYIEGNTFINTTSQATRVVSISGYTSVGDLTKIGDDSSENIVLADENLEGSKNIFIKNNVVIGFSDDASPMDSPMFYFGGCKVGFGEMENLVFVNNTIRDSYNVDKLNLPTPVGHDVIAVYYAKDVRISDNYIDLSRRVLISGDCGSIIVSGNIVNRCDHTAFMFRAGRTTENVVIKNNIVSASRGLALVDANNVIINNNKYDDKTTSKRIEYVLSILAYRITIKDNVLESFDNVGVGILLADRSGSVGFVKDNIILGTVEEVQNPNSGVVQ